MNDAILHVDLTLAAVALAVLAGMTLGLLTYRRGSANSRPRPPPRS
ncbi:hypothetical protein ACWEVP_01650 [Amycolatopsis sp. NPDC003865]